MPRAFEGLAEMRPRLRRDVLFTQTPGGVLFHNADGGFHLTGRTAYRFASLIVPHLDGSRPLVEICAGLGETQRAMVAELVGSLVERDFARDAAPSVEPGPPAGVAERFAAQIAYVDHYTDEAAARFARFRDTRVAVLGSGETARWAVLGLVRNGLAEVAAEERSAEALAEAADLTAAGCPATVTQLPAETKNLSGHQVLLVTGADAVARSQAILDAGLAEDQLLVPAWTFGERVVVGPRSGGLTAGCLGCALLRLGASTDPALAAGLLAELAGVAVPAPAPPGGPLTGPVAAMVGNLLAYEVFRSVTGALPPETEGQVLIQELDSLDVVAEPLRPHPRCRRCAERATDEGELRELPAALSVAPTVTVETARDAEELVARLNRLGDALVRPHVGVFARYRDEELTQTPLKVSRVEVPLGAAGTRLVAAFDVHHLAGARQRALRAASVLYEEHLVPVAALGELPPGVARLAPGRLVADGGTGAGLADVDSWSLVTSLLTKDELAVPTAALRPLGPPNRDRLVLPGGWGTGAGESPGEAAGHALLSALAHEALLRAVAGAAPVRALATGDDPEWVFLARSAETLEVAVELLDLGEAERSGARVALAREGSGRWAVGAALSRAGAAVAALRDLLGQVQLSAETGGAPDVGDPLVPELAPGAVALAEGTVAGGAVAEDDGEPATFPGVLERLRAAGRDALWCDSTPADLRAAGLHTARVLLTGENREGNGDAR
ncbi:TOMM precursor leader peptide-binding protein [Streptomyces sp. 3MP-14]|uniref:TOMM leader peptide-binding protein n=1 Tax=Streptomyces mimosae TaxID=2586635 RepID=A0A5N6AED6_9ACTN|nr:MULTISPECIES: TOMM precursor leader peptide-binding protein [Streptomyces]KAB8166542.1 TOMM precursor leader peptide-binding protein [Streptomyces mimosae]KAB8174225.1 TOMM precursor leader peptide-binding protein [Streptomyces sp. 3MP-14]